MNGEDEETEEKLLGEAIQVEKVMQRDETTVPPILKLTRTKKILSKNVATPIDAAPNSS